MARSFFRVRKQADEQRDITRRILHTSQAERTRLTGNMAHRLWAECFLWSLYDPSQPLLTDPADRQPLIVLSGAD